MIPRPTKTLAAATEGERALSVEPPEVPASVIVKLWRGVRDPLGFLTEIEAQFGDIVALRKDRSYAVFHPDYVKHVLQDIHANYEKGARYRAALAPLMGNGLFTSEGAFWLRQRRIAQGAFHRAHLPALVEPVRECVLDAAQRWEKKGRAGESVPLREEVTALTLRAALRMFFGVDAQAEMPGLIEAVFGVNEEIKLGRAPRAARSCTAHRRQEAATGQAVASERNNQW